MRRVKPEAIIDNVKIPVIALSAATLVSGIVKLPISYFPGFVISSFALIDTLLLGAKTSAETANEPLIAIFSIFITIAISCYCAWNGVKKLKLGAFESGAGGALIAAIPHAVALIVINITFYIPVVIPGLYKELGALSILAAGILILVQVVPLLIDFVVGFAFGAVCGLVFKRI